MILTPKIEKSPYRGRGDTPLPHPPPARSLRSLGLGRSAPSHFPLQVGNHPPPPPPTFEDLSTPLGTSPFSSTMEVNYHRYHAPSTNQPLVKG